MMSQSQLYLNTQSANEHVCDSSVVAQYCVLSGVDSRRESVLFLPLPSCMDTLLQALATTRQLLVVYLTCFAVSTELE